MAHRVAIGRAAHSDLGRSGNSDTRPTGGDVVLARRTSRAHHGRMSQALPEPEDEVEAWRDLQAVLEERDRDWWADAKPDEAEGD